MEIIADVDAHNSPSFVNIMRGSLSGCLSSLVVKHNLVDWSQVKSVPRHSFNVQSAKRNNATTWVEDESVRLSLAQQLVKYVLPSLSYLAN